MDYPRGKFDDCIFIRCGFIMQMTHTHRHTDADKRLTSATLIGVNNYGLFV